MRSIKRMDPLLGPNGIAKGVLEAVADALRADSAAAYLVQPDGNAYRRIRSLGTHRYPATIDGTGSLPAWLRTITAPTPLPVDLLGAVTAPSLSAALGVALRSDETIVGFLVLGPERTGAPYSAEDLAFLGTVAEYAARSIGAARLVETARARNIDTFDQVTTGVIHDLKNAVAALSLLARNAASNLGDPEFQRDAIATLSGTVARMQRLLVKLSAGAEPSPPTTEPIDLQELIIEATTPLATGRKVRLVRQLRPVKAVYGDHDALRRVIENLTTNAAEAIDHEGTVTVTLAEEQGHAIISVADTGRGISEDYQERHLFAPFRSTKKGGWGVGLYQTKQAVESQDGEILVESVEGHGTTFTVKLPLQADLESASLETVR